jgi:anti-sigma B factor antagonist
MATNFPPTPPSPPNPPQQPVSPGAPKPFGVGGTPGGPRPPGFVGQGASGARPAPKPAGLPVKRGAPKIQTMVGPENIAIVTILESRILDENNIADLGRQLMDLVKKQYMIKMIIDLGAVQYLSSAVLRQFIALYKAIKEEKGDLKFCRVNPEIREVFKITQLDKMIEIKEDLDTAISAFKERKGGWGFLTR